MSAIDDSRPKAQGSLAGFGAGAEVQYYVLDFCIEISPWWLVLECVSLTFQGPVPAWLLLCISRRTY